MARKEVLDRTVDEAEEDIPKGMILIFFVQYVGGIDYLDWILDSQFRYIL